VMAQVGGGGVEREGSGEPSFCCVTETGRGAVRRREMLMAWIHCWDVLSAGIRRHVAWPTSIHSRMHTVDALPTPLLDPPPGNHDRLNPPLSPFDPRRSASIASARLETGDGDACGCSGRPRRSSMDTHGGTHRGIG
jgi:hypothetical protein